MNKYILHLIFVLFLMGGCLLGTVCAIEENALSRIKLSPENLPDGIEISNEISASKQQLYSVRLKIGFPLKSLLNQTLVYENQPASINYMTLPTEEWFSAGYSKLTGLEGRRTLILSKEGVLLQITTRSQDFEDKIIDLLGPDPLHKHKIRVHRMTTGWGVRHERFWRGAALEDLERKFGVQIESMLEQEFLAGRKNIKISYYYCSNEDMAATCAEYLAIKGNPVFKRLVKYSGRLVAMAESQDIELNESALGLITW